MNILECFQIYGHVLDLLQKTNPDVTLEDVLAAASHSRQQAHAGLAQPLPELLTVDQAARGSSG